MLQVRRNITKQTYYKKEKNKLTLHQNLMLIKRLTKGQMGFY